MLREAAVAFSIFTERTESDCKKQKTIRATDRDKYRIKLDTRRTGLFGNPLLGHGAPERSARGCHRCRCFRAGHQVPGHTV